MLTNTLLISVFVIAYIVIVAVTWNQVPDDQDMTDEEREIALLGFYHP